MGTPASTMPSLAARTASRLWPGDLTGASLPPGSARLLALGIWLAVLGGVVQGVVHLATYNRAVDLLNADDEGTVWSWASSGTTFAAAVAALVLLAVRPSATVPLAVLAATFFFLSMDDAITLHERIVHSRVESLGPIDDGARVVWPLLYLPVLAAAFVLAWTLAQVVPQRVGRLLRIGLVLLVAAIAIEIAAAGLVEAGYESDSFVHNVEVAVEEGLELSGWMLVATALFAAAIAWAAPARPNKGQEAEKEGFEPSTQEFTHVTP